MKTHRDRVSIERRRFFGAAAFIRAMSGMGPGWRAAERTGFGSAARRADDVTRAGEFRHGVSDTLSCQIEAEKRLGVM